MTSPYRTLVFDFDGTLADTLPLCTETFRRLTEEVRGDRPSAEEVESFYGLSDRGIVGGLLNIHPDSPEMQAPLSRLVEIYKQLHPSLAPKPFDGVMELLRELKQQGLRLALITGKEAFTAIPSLEFYGMMELFDFFGYGDPHCNPKAERLRELMAQFQLSPKELIYVGDAPTDITHCHSVGVPIINAAWAEDSPRFEAACLALNPEYRFSSLAELKTFLMP